VPPEGVDLDQLRPWFAAHVPDARGAPLDAHLIAGGRSNLTYTIDDGTHDWVLRRPPLGHVVETAHDMRREYRVLSALHGTPVPVPEVYAFTDDAALIGAPFYVMERVHGRILRTPEEMQVLTPAEATACSEQLVDVLAALHSVDPAAVGLEDFGHPEGFLARNVARWGKQWQANKTQERPALDELQRRLEAAVPESGPAAIIHGDYRLDNTMLALDDPGRIVAVLDWEMSTLGDPLTDLGLFLVYWGGGAQLAVLTPQGASDLPGFFTRDEVIARYTAQSGRSVEHLDFYVIFAMYKLAVIVEGIHAIGATVATLSEQALELANRADDPRLRG
jgi:aminoglycoside phosphotransferase (APT) family kinase protein